MGGPGAMIAATAALAWPLTARLPAVLELMPSVGVVLLGSAQPADTMYQSGSPAASCSLVMPSVRQGRRPTAGSVQVPEAMPSLTVPMLAGASGQGRRPGLRSLPPACVAAQPMSA